MTDAGGAPPSGESLPGDSHAAQQGNGRERPLRVRMLVRYSDAVASARQRFYKFLPFLEAAGISAEIHPLLPGDYLARRSSGGSASRHGMPGAYRQRLRDLRRTPAPDLFFIQYESFPYLPAWLERLGLPRRVPYVLDYDDAWFHHYGEHPSAAVRAVLGEKVARLLERAAAVVVGSEYLAAYARRYSGNVHVIPTSIDLGDFPAAPPSPQPDAPFTVGWIGSPSTAPHLRIVAEPLGRFCARHRARVVVIGAGGACPAVPGLTNLPWSLATEVAEISRFDVGIMPLPDTPFARGKCAFKLIQYMGCWKPVIASPVGENTVVVEPGLNGFLARTSEEWERALDNLRAQPQLREQLGRQGRAKVERGYTLQGRAMELVRVLRAAAT